MGQKHSKKRKLTCNPSILSFAKKLSLWLNLMNCYVYILEFKMGNGRKSYYIEKDKVKIWKEVATWNKVISSKLSMTFEAKFKVSLMQKLSSRP